MGGTVPLPYRETGLRQFPHVNDVGNFISSLHGDVILETSTITSPAVLGIAANGIHGDDILSGENWESKGAEITHADDCR